MKKGVGPKSPREFGAEQESPNFFLADAHGSLAPGIECMRMSGDLFNVNGVSGAIRSEPCALGELPCSVHANVGDFDACHREEFVG